ncbi:MAG: hypothetical protein A3G41_01405 [Elusimicrobia bacterium RIFCSPLOWO2_12_FULL_59_9]|nr:MAG: hypothetical protein A3G41_01405 [Elusimicrobia bacterium RIFCSPLOWO2_12_FULL_59_9]
MDYKQVHFFSVPCENRPGALSHVTHVLSKKGINLLAVDTTNLNKIGFVHFVAEKKGEVTGVLAEAGLAVFGMEAFFVELQNRPGQLAALAKALSHKSVNIEKVYGTTPAVGPARLVLIVDNPAKARSVLKSL